MSTRLTDPACSIRVGDIVFFKISEVRLIVEEVFLDGHVAWCEIEEIEDAGRLMIAKVRDLVKIGPLH